MTVRRQRRQHEAQDAFAVGPIRKDARTKRLVRRLRPGDIAVIDHADLDRVAAETLVECRPAAVVNVASSITGRYANAGPGVLLEAGIGLLDAAGPGVFNVREGEVVRLDHDGGVWLGDTEVAHGEWLTVEDARKRTDAARDNIAGALEDFTLNTLSFLRRDRDLLLEGVDIPTLRTPLVDRHVLVVVRGPDYKKDLEALRGYIREFRPVLMGVDGGADALLEVGLRPDVIIGDMDSVTSRALGCGAELVVHAYPDGRAPGLERLQELGLTPLLFPAAGTSEDLAMLLAFEAGSDLIVAVGTHASLIDFLDKGRPGMASTFLVRLKVGSKLVDAKGVNRLYRQGVGRLDLMLLVGAALVAIVVAASVSEPVRLFGDSLWHLLETLADHLRDLV